MSRAGGMLLDAIEKIIKGQGSARIEVSHYGDRYLVDVSGGLMEMITGTGAALDEAVERVVLQLDEKAGG